MPNHRRPPRGRPQPESSSARPLSAEERANLHKLALQWRAEWRAKTCAVEPPRPRRTARKPVKPESATGDAAFAAAIARAEFGRFYWNGTLDNRLKAAMRPRLKDGGNAGATDKPNGKARR